MVLSEEGKKRWKEAIEQNKPFVPFKELEHLHPFMTPEQKEQLTRILKIRNQTKIGAA